MVCGERFVESITLTRHQIDAKLVAKCDEIASGLMVAFDKLGNQLLDASLYHGRYPLLFTLFELDRLVQRTLERIARAGVAWCSTPSVAAAPS